MTEECIAGEHEDCSDSPDDAGECDCPCHGMFDGTHGPNDPVQDRYFEMFDRS